MVFLRPGGHVTPCSSHSSFAAKLRRHWLLLASLFLWLASPLAPLSPLPRLTRNSGAAVAFAAPGGAAAPTPEKLMQALGRELWCVGSELLAASAGLAQLQGGSIVGGGKPEPANGLTYTGVALRNAACGLMDGGWENVMGELETAAASCDEYFRESDFEGLVSLFSYVDPVPACEFANARKSLGALSTKLASQASRIGDMMPDVSEALNRASQILSRSKSLFESGGFYMPVDYRTAEGSSWGRAPARPERTAAGVDDSFQRVRETVFRQTERNLQSTYASQLLVRIDGELKVLGTREDRKRVLQRLVRELHPDQNKGREAEVAPIFQYIQRLREEDKSLVDR